MVGGKKTVVLVRAQSAALPGRGSRSSSTPTIAGSLDIVRDSVGKPCAVVGDPRAHALAGMRQPPMLDIALDELPRRRAQQMCSRVIVGCAAVSAMPSCN